MRLDNILDMVFNSTMKYYIIFLSVALILSMFAEWRNKEIGKRLITVPFIAFFGFILFIYVKRGYLIGIGENPLYLEVLKWAYYPIVIMELTVIYFRKINMVSVCLVLGILSELVMVATSEMSPRTMVPLILFCLPYIISVYADAKMPFYIDRVVGLEFV